ncbi:MAG: hypothetical protein CBC48_16455 [bacterium TMED88]|nr:hypothetical protein [Deltaproteobacteria bacterium]OUV25446.1 MAG: hypothetical protein CBC48_16455 [bacterium TMED88]
MEYAKNLDLRSFADSVGILGSAICALHCMATPVLIMAGASLPLWQADDESFHQTMLWLIVPSSIMAFSLGCWRHKDRWVLALGALGLFGITLPIAAPHGVLSEVGERWVTVCAAAMLVAAHLRNFKRCRADGCEHRVVSV